jgi:hypothetical protein
MASVRCQMVGFLPDDTGNAKGFYRSLIGMNGRDAGPM